MVPCTITPKASSAFQYLRTSCLTPLFVELVPSPRDAEWLHGPGQDLVTIPQPVLSHDLGQGSCWLYVSGLLICKIGRRCLTSSPHLSCRSRGDRGPPSGQVSGRRDGAMETLSASPAGGDGERMGSGVEVLGSFLAS